MRSDKIRVDLPRASHLRPLQLRVALFAGILILLLVSVLGLQISLLRDPPPQKLSIASGHLNQTPEQSQQPTTISGISASSNLGVQPEYPRKSPSLANCDTRFDQISSPDLKHSCQSYYDPVSKSILNCFYTQTSKEVPADSICVTGPSWLDHRSLKLAYRLGGSTGNVLKSKRLSDLFRSYIDIASHLLKAPPGSKPKYTILVRREEGFNNPWNSLWQIFSLYMFMDVLQSTVDPQTGNPFLARTDINNAQVVILDDYEDGPIFDLWALVARKPVIRWSDLSSGTPDLGRIILPWAGNSIKMRQKDWDIHPCRDSKLSRTSSQRLIKYYDIGKEKVPDNGKLVLTFTERHDTGRLVDQEWYMEILEWQFPDVIVQMIDFASIPSEEQLRVMHRTNILVGIHGPGLIHSIFQPPGSAIVEILPPGLNQNGFQKLANLKGHRYFSAHALELPATHSEYWRKDDIYMEQGRFLELMTVAIKSTYDERLLKKGATDVEAVF